MVHVRVCEQHEVDLGQVSDAQSRMTEAAQEDEASGEDRVDENISAAELDEE